MENVDAGSFLSVVYHDIFDYPLTKSELFIWRTNSKDRQKLQVFKTGKYYHLKNRKELVLKRKARELESKGKIKIAQTAANLMSVIPTILFVGISGSLAMNNSARESDIDLFIITRAKTLWTSRVLTKVLLMLNGVSVRMAGRAFSGHALCLNMWVDENHMAIEENRRDYYTAHEVLQIIPLVNKENTFEKYLKENEWAKKYWPNALERFKIYDLRFTRKLKNHKSYLLNLISCFFEPFVYRLQLWFMRKHRTSERVAPGYAYFHPFDWQGHVREQFERLLE